MTACSCKLVLPACWPHAGMQLRAACVVFLPCLWFLGMFSACCWHVKTCFLWHVYSRPRLALACLCLRTENRSRKTRVFEYVDFGVGWGGVLTFLVLRTWYIATLLRSLGSLTTLHVATLLRPLVWGGVGWGGGVLTFLVLRTWYIATLLRSLGSFTTLHVATLLRPLVWVGVGWVPSNLSAKSDLLMVYARAWQWRCIHKNADCQLFTTHALQRWSWKRQKRTASFSRLSNHQIGTAWW